MRLYVEKLWVLIWAEEKICGKIAPPVIFVEASLAKLLFTKSPFSRFTTQPAGCCHFNCRHIAIKGNNWPSPPNCLEIMMTLIMAAMVTMPQRMKTMKLMLRVVGGTARGKCLPMPWHLSEWPLVLYAELCHRKSVTLSNTCKTCPLSTVHWYGLAW